MDNKNNIWIVALCIFVLGRLIFFELLNPVNVILLLCYCISIGWFVAPYILGKDINLPGYTYNLSKGKDNAARLIFFIMGLVMCIICIVNTGSLR